MAMTELTNPSAWAADPLNNWLGRRGTIFLTGLL